jgi:hypothetical protein
MPCCFGLAMIKTSGPVVGLSPCVLGRMLPLDTRLIWVDPDAFFHPPQV